MTTINLDMIVDRLHAHGCDGYVEMTGGGCATIYAGPTRDMTTRIGGDDGRVVNYKVWAVLAGPGWFEGPGYTLPRADVLDFYIGQDSEYVGRDVDSDYIRPHTTDPDAIARLIIATIPKETTHA